ncbi:histidine kinase, partial [Amycolatopsis sp. NPDC000673]
MPGPGFAVPRRDFVRTLLHRGSPPERPDAGEDLAAVGDATLARAARYWVVVPVAYRIAAFVK